MKPNTAKCWGIFAAASLLSLAATIPAFAQQVAGKKLQPLNVKPGLWQTTTTYRVSGELPLPPDALEKLTPEQRAQIEQSVKRNGATQTVTDKHCVTQEELRSPLNESHCTWNIVESTSTRARGSVACEEQGMDMNGTGDFEAVDPEHMKGSAHLTSTGSGRSMTTDATFTSSWLGSSCGNVK